MLAASPVLAGARAVRPSPIASRTGRLLAVPFGLCFAALGTVALLSVLGVLPSKVPPTAAYRVFGLCASTVFITAGLGVVLFGLGFQRVAAKAGGVALLAFLLAFNWIAFGPGERTFTRKLSSSLTAPSVSQVPEWEGRTVFGIVALLMDAVLVFGVVRGRRSSSSNRS